MVPDYYAMLGVEPTADRPTLEEALARCQPKWSSGTRNPKNKHTYQSYLDQIPALRQALLGEPSVRAAYDAELAAGKRIERDRKLDELQRLVRLRAAKGGLTASDRTSLGAEADKRGLTHDDLDRLAEPFPDLPEGSAPVVEPDEPVADVIDPATRRQVLLTLEHLQRRDLYDVLGLPRDAPTAEIVARADAERQRWMRKSQVTAEKTAWLEAVSYAQSHLSGPAARARYDRTLVLEAEERLDGAIAFALEGVSRLDPGTRQILVDEATSLGIAPDRADRLIGRACRARGIAPDGGGAATPADGPPRLLRCRECGGVTEYSQVARDPGAPCRHCRASLQWSCPVCQRSRWVDERRCLCGFLLEHREPLVRHFEAAQHAHKARDHAAALTHLQRVLELAPKHVGARKGIEKVKQKLAGIETARAAVDVELQRRHLVAARKALGLWAQVVDPTDPDLRSAGSSVTKGLRDAVALATRARSLAGTDPAAARGLYRQALALAADLAEARDGLQACPPDPPGDLRAEVQDGRVRLLWSAPPPDGLGALAFRVVRKRRGVPAHPADGETVAETAATEFADAGVVPGEAVGYAVFSRRRDVDSLAGASAGPVLVLAEVADVRVEVRSGEVELSWTAPAAAAEIRVVRKEEAPPEGPDDGRRLSALRNGARDEGLQDNQVYHYGIFAVYRTPEGTARVSRGAFVAAMPHAPVHGVEDLILSHEPDGRVRLSWTEPARGQVKILRTMRPLAKEPGDRLSAAEAEALDGHWLDALAPDTVVDPRPPALGICYYTSLTSWAGTLTVGAGAMYSRVPDPSDLRAVRAGNAGRVHLRWRWSPQGAQALAVCKAGSYPTGPDDPEARRQEVAEAEYSRQGFATLSLPPDPRGPWHVRVFSMATLAGERVVSPGLEPSARTIVPGPLPEVTVSYSLRRPRFPGRPWSVTFRTEPAGAAIPPMALVAHPRTVPLSVHDGEVVEQFPAARDGATFNVRAGLNLLEHRVRVFPDPYAEPDGLPPIRLRHPEAEGTRV
jgi:hypothetical protein